MPDVDIHGLKDDESWRRLTSVLLDSAVADQWFEIMRARLMARLRHRRDEDVDDT
jgi:hypothetical protein